MTMIAFCLFIYTTTANKKLITLKRLIKYVKRLWVKLSDTLEHLSLRIHLKMMIIDDAAHECRGVCQ